MKKFSATELIYVGSGGYEVQKLFENVIFKQKSYDQKSTSFNEKLTEKMRNCRASGNAQVDPIGNVEKSH
jgi:hypothetical protein